MSDAPERIWAHCEPDDDGGTYIEYLSDEPWPGEDVGVEYIRADLARSQIEALARAAGSSKRAGWTLDVKMLMEVDGEIHDAGWDSCLEIVELAMLSAERRILAALNLQEGK